MRHLSSFCKQKHRIRGISVSPKFSDCHIHQNAHEKTSKVNQCLSLPALLRLVLLDFCSSLLQNFCISWESTELPGPFPPSTTSITLTVCLIRRETPRHPQSLIWEPLSNPTVKSYLQAGLHVYFYEPILQKKKKKSRKAKKDEAESHQQETSPASGAA